jgi:hypothetical protein
MTPYWPRNILSLTRSCFKTFQQRDPEAGEIDEGLAGREKMFMADLQSAESSLRGVGALDDPTALVAAQFPYILVRGICLSWKLLLL